MIQPMTPSLLLSSCSGKLLDKGIMPLKVEEAVEEGIRVDAESVEKFWQDNVCAPG